MMNKNMLKACQSVSVLNRSVASHEGKRRVGTVLVSASRLLGGQLTTELGFHNSPSFRVRRRPMNSSRVHRAMGAL